MNETYFVWKTMYITTFSEQLWKLQHFLSDYLSSIFSQNGTFSFTFMATLKDKHNSIPSLASVHLTHWGLNKVVDILQMTISNAVVWKKIILFWLDFIEVWSQTFKQRNQHW